MRDLALLLIHLIATVAKLLLPGGARSIIAESLLLKHQLLVLNRSRSRAPNLRPLDRVIAGLCATLIHRARLIRAVVLRSSTLMRFHDALVERKYRLLFTPRKLRKSGRPKGPGLELIAAIVEMKRRNPRFGCRRIAQQLSFVFGVEFDKDIVRRVLTKHYRPTDDSDGAARIFLDQDPSVAVNSVHPGASEYARCKPRSKFPWRTAVT